MDRFGVPCLTVENGISENNLEIASRIREINRKYYMEHKNKLD